MSDEVWRSFAYMGVDYSGLYEVSDMGRVRSVDRVVMKGNGVPMTVRGRVLKPIDREGYVACTLSKVGEQQPAVVHRIVASVFVPGKMEGAEVCHCNGDRADNRAVNLRWDTRSANSLDRALHGTDHQRNKERCPYGHLLVMPNLRRGLWEKRGHRSCLACHRADSYIRGGYAERGEFREVAASKYAKIMAGAEAL